MYILLKEGKLKEIIRQALRKAKSWKETINQLKIPKSKISTYQKYNIALKKERLEKIAEYAEIKIKKEDIEKEFPDNWRQIIGGNKCFRKKEKEGTLNKQLAESRSQISEKNTFKNWHKNMKKENPEQYHIIQYERFKKIGGYKFTTNNGENVRNALEKEVADLLKKYRTTYKYEPLIKANKEYFFPDFLIKENIILECTAWRGYEKAFKLKMKIEQLKEKYKVYVVIPKKISKYYSSISDYLLYTGEDFEKFIKGLAV